MKALYTLPSLFLGLIAVYYLGLFFRELENIKEPLGFEMLFLNLNNAVNPNLTGAFTAFVVSFALFFIFTLLMYSHIQKKSVDEQM